MQPIWHVVQTQGANRDNLRHGNNVTEITKPISNPKYFDGMHFLNLEVWGRLPHCKPGLPIFIGDRVAKRAPEHLGRWILVVGISIWAVKLGLWFLVSILGPWRHLLIKHKKYRKFPKFRWQFGSFYILWKRWRLFPCEHCFWSSDDILRVSFSPRLILEVKKFHLIKPVTVGEGNSSWNRERKKLHVTEDRVTCRGWKPALKA